MDNDVVLWIVVATALAFDFTNGFHDTANAVATSISTRALKPRVAVGYSAVLNFVGAFLSLEVAATIASGIVEAELVTPAIVVVWVSLLAGVVVTTLFSLVVLGGGKSAEARRRGRGSVATLYATLAVLAFTLFAALVVFGVNVMLSKD
jgi:inorganic phosphate transporter, PiT family